MRKPNTKWSALGGLDPHRGFAGSPFAPLRSPGRNRAAKKLATGLDLIWEWIDEWAGGGAVTGESSLSLGGSVSLTLVGRERKRRDSNRGPVIEVRAIAFKAQQRLHKRYRVLTGQHKKAVIVVAALAQELARPRNNISSARRKCSSNADQ